jgi:hypothetical protein
MRPQLLGFFPVPYFVYTVVGIFAEQHIPVIPAYIYRSAKGKSHAVERQVAKYRFGAVWAKRIILFVQVPVYWVKPFFQRLFIFPVSLKGGLYGFKNIGHCLFLLITK